jgi:hypothetical protein
MSNYQNVTPNQLGQAALTTSYATIYTVPANTRTYLKDMDICNTTAGSLNVFVSVVASSGTAGTANSIFYTTLVPAYSTLQWSGTQVMLPGVTLQAKGSGTGLTLTVSGGEAV